MKEPPYADQERVFKLRCKSKLGHGLSDEELEYCASMSKKYKAWYGSLDKRVFDATKPYGAG